MAVGQNLIVPQQPTVLMAARSDRAVPAVDAADARRGRRGAGCGDCRRPTRATGASEDRVKVVYRVKRGDTLASIARVFRTSVGLDPHLERHLGLAHQRGRAPDDLHRPRQLSVRGQADRNRTWPTIAPDCCRFLHIHERRQSRVVTA